ncbi:TonB-dependent siderophore receptor [Silvimonas iriomotensis]|uniref:Ferric siderophore receptor n=1 Tax=Silvimonas iriomotensis TaxID=449662 RepID=A0ABQ2PCV9_9NEIS|nr:TonB-dependent receptor [Silvimonas iriomotensis]GGP23374.1 ferric siderophore receptor [Silvimonas iriomotensis]
MKTRHRWAKTPCATLLCPFSTAVLLGFAAPAFADDTAALPDVTVTAAQQSELATPSTGGALGSRKVIDTPFSQTVVSGQDLADRQVRKLGDVFAADASVSDNSDASNAWASYLTVRGLQLDWQNGYKIDGLPFIGYGVNPPYEQFERVELLKGLSGFMYGFGAPGGVVNYVTKKAEGAPVRSIDIGYTEDSVLSEHADFGQRFGPGNMFGARINYTHEGGDTINGGQTNRNSVSLALDAQINDRLSTYFNMLYQQRRSDNMPASLSFASYTGKGMPGTVAGDTSNLNSDGQHLYTGLQLYTAGLQYQLTPDWRLSTRYSYSESTRDRNESTLYLADNSGNYSDYRWIGKEGNRFAYWDAMAEGKVQTGAVSHLITAGASWQQQANYYGANSFYGLLGTGNIYSASTNSMGDIAGLQTYHDSDITQKALFASDTLGFGEHWSLLAGLRYTNYQQNAFGVTGASTGSYDKNGVATPTVALMYKFSPATTAYASYVESLEQGSTVASTYANAGEMLKPLRSKQYELGLKHDSTVFSTTAALFRIERGAEYGNADNVYVQDGMSVYQGAELVATWRPASQWQVGGSLMGLKTWYGEGSSNRGNRVAGAPELVAAGQIEYKLPAVPGLKLGLDGKYTGDTMITPTGSLNAGGYTVFNLGAVYNLHAGAYDYTFRAALNNLTNREYWEFQYANYVKAGDPRTISLNAAVNF